MHLHCLVISPPPIPLHFSFMSLSLAFSLHPLHLPFISPSFPINAFPLRFPFMSPLSRFISLHFPLIALHSSFPVNFPFSSLHFPFISPPSFPFISPQGWRIVDLAQCTCWLGGKRGEALDLEDDALNGKMGSLLIPLHFLFVSLLISFRLSFPPCPFILSIPLMSPHALHYPFISLYFLLISPSFPIHFPVMFLSHACPIRFPFFSVSISPSFPFNSSSLLLVALSLPLIHCCSVPFHFPSISPSFPWRRKTELEPAKSRQGDSSLQPPVFPFLVERH